MASTSLGKKWESVFKAGWKKSFPDTFIHRLPDQLGGFSGKAGSNICDFICFPGSTLFLIELKEHKGASIPFIAIPQYERLLEYKNMLNVKAGVIVWFSEKDTVIWVPIKEMEKMVNDGEKSIGLRMLENKLYNITVLPSEKKRVFLETDYRPLLELFEEN